MVFEELFAPIVESVRLFEHPDQLKMGVWVVAIHFGAAVGLASALIPDSCVGIEILVFSDASAAVSRIDVLVGVSASKRGATTESEIYDKIYDKIMRSKRIEKAVC